MFSVAVDYELSPEMVLRTDSSASVKWQPSTQVPSGLAGYYTYVVEAASDNDTVQAITQFGNSTAEIERLLHNTQYTFTVRIDAEHNNQTRQGKPGSVLIVRTRCAGKSNQMCLVCFKV